MVGFAYSADELVKAISLEAVVGRYGNPVRSDLAPSFGVDRKIVYFPAQDEFGNPCLAVLTFQAVCSNDRKTPDCYKLVEPVRSTADPNVSGAAAVS